MGSDVTASNVPGPVLRLHRWLATPSMELSEERFQLFAVTNWSMALGLVSHVLFCAMFFAVGVPALGLFNVFSVAVFAAALRLARSARLNESLLVASAEVVAHAWYATALLGWDSGFHFHIVLALVLMVLFTILSSAQRIALAGLTGASYVALAAWGTVHAADHMLPVVVVQAMNAANTAIFTTVLSGICVYYTWTVSITRARRDEAERELVDALEQTRELERLKSDFTAMVSHELRTPLTSILGFAKVIRGRLDEHLIPALPDGDRKVDRAVSQVRGNVDIVISEGERLTALINDVLDIAKMEAGRMEYAVAPLEPADVVARAVAATRGLFAERPVMLLEAISPHLPQLQGDRDRLQQVLVNLISNAAKFTEAGTVTVAAESTQGRVRFSVVDTGPGIPSDHVGLVFEKFRQAGTLDDKPRGTGLGLAICRQIVEAHEGRIWVESTVGQGSRFAFEVPIG